MKASGHGPGEVSYQPATQLLSVFWQTPRKRQIATKLKDGVILIKDERTCEPIGVELLSYQPGDARFNAVTVEIARHPAPPPAA